MFSCYPILRDKSVSFYFEKDESELFSDSLMDLTWNVESEVSAGTVHWHHKLILKSHYR